MTLHARIRATGKGRASIVRFPNAVSAACACAVVLLSGCGSLQDPGRTPSTPSKGTNVWDIASADAGTTRPRPLDR